MSGMAWWRQAVDRSMRRVAARQGDVAVTFQCGQPGRLGCGLLPMGETSEAELIARRDLLLRQRLAKAAYCTTTNPQLHCTPLPGIAKPMRADALAAFKQLQAQLNRLLAHYQAAPVAVDGRIGPGVMRALDLVRSKIAFAPVVLPRLSLDQTAETAEAGGAVVKLLADNLALPVTAPAAPSVPSTSSGGAVQHPPDSTVVQAAGLGPAGAPPWLLLAAGGVAVMLLWKTPTPKPRRRRRSR